MLYLLAASVVWSFSFGLIKGNLTNLDPTFVTFVRLFIAIPIFLPFLRWQAVSLGIALRLILIGAIQYGVMYILCISAYQYLQAYQVVLFSACTPIYVALIHNVIEKRFNPTYLVLAILACMGAGLIHFQTFNLTQILKGFLLIQSADLCFASGQVLYRRLMKNIPMVKNSQIYALLFIGATLIASMMVTLNGTWNNVHLLTTKQISILFYLGTVASGVAFFWWNKGATLVDIGTLAVTNNFKIPFAVLVSVMIFGENANLLKLFISISIILSAVGYARWYELQIEKTNFK